ncbi:MAG: FprA family A-type flavoprotein [Deltaproteobacteria bacterium]|nr:FprA family A-type flavoprotein [Deltaproteobacteria bacterium]
MELKKITEGVWWAGAADWDRRLFDALVPLPDGTSYNAYLVKGTGKTALIDTVDPTKTAVLMNHLEKVESLDYIISQHAEQDHSGAIPEVLRKYPDAIVITNSKGKEFLSDLLNVDGDRVRTVAEGEKLSLGGKTLEFISTPWVHWPETFSTFLREDRILFSCDLFGSHLATTSVFVEDEWKAIEAAKRYYAEVMMPFRTTIRKHIEKFEQFPVETIAPSHGPVYRNSEKIVMAHRDWVSERVSNTVLLPYATMHGSTELMVDYLTESLASKGIGVQRFNLATTDTGKLVMSLVDAASIVIGSPTVLTGAHPSVISAAFLVNALRPKLKFASIIGSMGWGGKMVEQITATIANLKVDLIAPVVVKGRPKEDDYAALEKLAGEIAIRHRTNNIV